MALSFHPAGMQPVNLLLPPKIHKVVNFVKPPNSLGISPDRLLSCIINLVKLLN